MDTDQMKERFVVLYEREDGWILGESNMCPGESTEFVRRYLKEVERTFPPRQA